MKNAFCMLIYLRARRRNWSNICFDEDYKPRLIDDGRHSGIELENWFWPGTKLDGTSIFEIQFKFEFKIVISRGKEIYQ